MPAAGVPATDADGEVMSTPAVTPAGTPQPQPTPQAQPTPPPQPKPQPTPQATRQTRSMREAEAQPTPQPGPPAVAEKAPPSQPKTVQAAKGAEQALPDDVAKWKKEDYDRARQGNVALLLKVVEYLGQKGAKARWRPRIDHAAETPARRVAAAQPGRPVEVGRGDCRGAGQ